ncbi:YeiH family protein [Rhizosaccharibacter radicis]|uniref:Sulfate exporter family transporter n=1 Tax=Rhizosaccharibacter radicis TaxID=2782605 RepID=A0ABT1VUL9_9PROT|nr:putative sulfate exporter family transporter [Acetobacteraceae bacterium KSS12]
MPTSASVSLSSAVVPQGDGGTRAGSVGPIGRALPGLALCLAVTAGAFLLAGLERRAFGAVWLEPLVLAIVLGAAARACWMPGARWKPGIAVGGKLLLEIAVVLLGASLSTRALLAAGPALIIGVAAVVVLAVGASYAIGRALGLPHRMATLVACGNSICGNSAIAAVAPVIGASGEDVAASISFTAVFGVALVLGLPVLVPLLHLSGLQYGALAGLTVYAVPQVLAATAPAGPVAVQLGTMVKLVRVLMLGPVVVALALLHGRTRTAADDEAARGTAGANRPGSVALPLSRVVPWFIAGFLVTAGMRSFHLIPGALLPPMADAASLLTVVSMAALGLGTDIRSAARSGGRIVAAVVLSLLMLGAIGFGLIRLLGMA